MHTFAKELPFLNFKVYFENMNNLGLIAELGRVGSRVTSWSSARKATIVAPSLLLPPPVASSTLFERTHYLPLAPCKAYVLWSSRCNTTSVLRKASALHVLLSLFAAPKPARLTM